MSTGAKFVNRSRASRFVFALATTLVCSRLCLAGGNALQTAINGPHQLAVDSAGRLYVSEEYSSRILRVDLNKNRVTVIAGNGHQCCREENVPARKSSIYRVYSLTVDTDNNLYIGGRNAHDVAFIRIVHNNSGRIETIAGGGPPAGAAGVRTSAVNLSDPRGILATVSGKVLVSADESHVIIELGQATRLIAGICGQKGFSGDGGPATLATFDSPGALASDAQGNVFVADYFNHRIRRVDAATGVVTTIAGNGSTVSSGDGGLATAAGVPYPYAIATDIAGNVFVVENGGFRIRRVDSSRGIIETVAGTGHDGFSGDSGPANRADMNPAGLAIDRDGNLYISDIEHNRVRRVDRIARTISTVAGNGLPHRKVVIE